MGQEYLNPRCTFRNIDRFVVRTRILKAVTDVLPQIEGKVLDLGCGHMPYKSLILSSPSRAKKYIGLDLHDNIYSDPDIAWDGKKIPISSNSISCVIATEVFEHCPKPENVLVEIFRVLKTEGLLFFYSSFSLALTLCPPR